MQKKPKKNTHIFNFCILWTMLFDAMHASDEQFCLLCFFRFLFLLLILQMQMYAANYWEVCLFQLNGWACGVFVWCESIKTHTSTVCLNNKLNLQLNSCIVTFVFCAKWSRNGKLYRHLIGRIDYATVAQHVENLNWNIMQNCQIDAECQPVNTHQTKYTYYNNFFYWCLSQGLSIKL